MTTPFAAARDRSQAAGEEFKELTADGFKVEIATVRVVV